MLDKGMETIINIDNCKLKPQDLVFLVGCGVSIDSPSNLPSGKELTEFVIQQACGKKCESRITEIWSSIIDNIKKVRPDLNYPILRLETLLNLLNEIDRNEKRTPILNGLKSYAYITPNQNHKSLAFMLHEGASILTMNFDMGIEIAYEDKYESLLRGSFDNKIPYYQTRRDGIAESGTIIHLHGDTKIFEYSNLGATMSQVKEGVPQDTAETFTSILSKAKLLIVLGYSVSDSYDITPFFREFVPPKETASLCFINHSEIGYSETLKDEGVAKASILGKNYSTIQVEVDNTWRWLKSFANEYGFEDTMAKKNDSDMFKSWKLNFLESWRVPYTENDRYINNAAVRFHIGYNPELVENGIGKRFKELSHKNVSKRTRTYLEEALEHSNGIESEPKAITRIEYLQNMNSLFRAKNKSLNSKYLQHIFKICNYTLCKYMISTTPVNRCDKFVVRRAINLLRQYVSYPYSKFAFLSNLATCMRYLCIFEMRFNKIFEINLLDDEINLVLDISYAEGVIRALRDRIHLNIYRSELNNLNDQELNQTIDDINLCAECGRNMSIATGFKNHATRFEKLMGFTTAKELQSDIMHYCFNTVE